MREEIRKNTTATVAAIAIEIWIKHQIKISANHIKIIALILSHQSNTYQEQNHTQGKHGVG